MGIKDLSRHGLKKTMGLKTVYGYSILNGEEEVCAVGSSTHIIVKKDEFQTHAFKKAFPEWYLKYEEVKKK